MPGFCKECWETWITGFTCPNVETNSSMIVLGFYRINKITLSNLLMDPWDISLLQSDCDTSTRTGPLVSTLIGKLLSGPLIACHIMSSLQFCRELSGESILFIIH